MNINIRYNLNIFFVFIEQTSRIFFSYCLVMCPVRVKPAPATARATDPVTTRLSLPG